MTEEEILKSAEKFHKTIRIDEYKKGRPYQYAHLKRDGWCLYVFKDHYGKVWMCSRKPRIVTCEQPWAEALEKSLKPGDLVIGEIFVEGGSSQDVASVFAANPTKVGTFEGFYTPLCDSLNSFSHWCYERSIVPIATTTNIEEIPEGYEGFVLKNRYHPNIRNAWMRHKPSKTLDLRICGKEYAFEGKFAREGLLKNIYVKSDDDKIFCKVGVMTDSMRHEFTHNFDKYVGTVVEIECQFITPDGSLRHPRFNRIRDDKDTTD